jgi:hypothetical protein
VDKKQKHTVLWHSLWQVAPPLAEKVPMGHAVGCEVFAGHMEPAGQRYALLLAQNDPAGHAVHAS